MKKVDYIVVGLGLAGLAFCEQLRKNNKSFIVFDDDAKKASKVAGGVYNPVNLKRFTAAWMAQHQLVDAKNFYKALEAFLKIKFVNDTPVLKKFHSVEEQNNWFIASDKPIVKDYLSLDLLENLNTCLMANLGFGLVKETGWIDTSILLDAYAKWLNVNNQLFSEKLDYFQLEIDSEVIRYKGFESKYIVFCEGFGVKNNPYFKDLPLVGNKGEVLIIKSITLNLRSILKSSVFLIPLGNHEYYVGATYNRNEQSLQPTEEAKNELLNKLDSLIKCDYEIIDHKVGIRPTVKDRRPLVGIHQKYHNLAILNGLGTRGVMVGPYIAEQLYDYIESNRPLNPEINISRFN